MLFTFETRDGDDDESSLDHFRRQELIGKDLLYTHNSFSPFMKLQFEKCESVLGNPGLLTQLAGSDMDIAIQIDRIFQNSQKAPAA